MVLRSHIRHAKAAPHHIPSSRERSLGLRKHPLPESAFIAVVETASCRNQGEHDERHRRQPVRTRRQATQNQSIRGVINNASPINGP